MATVTPEQVIAQPRDALPPHIRPALVNGHPCYVECPSWCTEDHVAANERHLEDVCHTSGAADLMAPRQDGSACLMLLTRLLAGNGASSADRQPLVTVDVDDVNGMYLEPDAADEFADSLVAFAERVRGLADVARTANAAA